MAKRRYHSDDSKNTNNSLESDNEDTLRTPDGDQTDGHNKEIKYIPTVFKKINQWALGEDADQDFNGKKYGDGVVKNLQ